MWILSDSAIKSLTDLPETGMGFQFVGAMALGKKAPFLVLNSE